MSERDDDAMRDLRKLWQQLESPAPDGSGDEATQASVAWAQAAWKSVAPGVQALELRRRPRPLRILPFALPLAAAAAYLIWIGPGETPSTLNEPSPASLTASAPLRAYPVADGSLELRRGCVRLILFDNPSSKDQ